MDAGLVEKTWEAVGYKVRPMFAKVFVLTDAPPEKIGMLYLPPKLSDFHGGFGHQRLVTATVLACGPLARSVKPGDRVVFRRLDFGFIVKLEKGVYVGFIEQEQLAGYPEGEGDIESLGDSDEGDPTV
jgi:hypothetical protein